MITLLILRVGNFEFFFFFDKFVRLVIKKVVDLYLDSNYILK